MTEKPLVSVIAVCYNHSRFVIECLDSIRNQTYPNIQLIIMDDCSQDDSVERIHEWVKDNHIECEFITHSQNQGVCRTFNEAVRLAQGSYISLIATDDTWLPDKISHQVSIMESLPKTMGVLYSDAYQIDENSHRLPDMFIVAHRKFHHAPEGDLREHLIIGNFIPAMTTLIRRSVYDHAGLYDENLSFEDWDFWLRVSNHFNFAYSPYPSANYRILDTSLARTLLSKKNAISCYSYFQILKKILMMPDISQSSRTLTAKRLSNYAHELYVMGHPEAPCALISSFIATRHPSNLYCAVLGSLHISHKNYIRTLDYLTWRFSCLSIRNFLRKKRK